MNAPERPNDAFDRRWRSQVVLKRDVFSTVERGRFVTPAGEVEAVLRRVDLVPWWSRPLARHFLRREARTLAVAGALGIAPPLLFADRERLIRGYLPGVAMRMAQPFGDRGYFKSARSALHALHRAGICHNDLAKQQNWLRGTDGKAYLLDFQLAAKPSRRHKAFRVAAYEDLRHLLKHKRHYVPDALTAAERRILARKSWVNRVWMATGKRVYYFVSRDLFGFVDAEGGGTRLVRDAPRIEAALMAHPQVRAVVIQHLPGRQSGTGLYAFVEALGVSDAELEALTVKAVGKDTAPEFLQCVDRLPRSATGQVRNDVLRMIATNQVDLIDALVAPDAERATIEPIVRARKNLYDIPAVTAALRAHPSSRDAIVFAIPDRIAGTALYGFVEAASDLDERTLREFIGRGSDAITPQYLQIVDTLPRRDDRSIRSDILQRIAINQVEDIHALVTSEAEREIVDRILNGRKNFRDRFVL